MRSRLVLGALIGLVSAAVAVGVGELMAAFIRPASAPVVAVANRMILLTPESAKRSAINSFGTNDKTVLLVLIYVLLAVFGVLVGVLALRRLAYGLAGIAVFAAFGVYCALTANASHASDVIPTLVGAAVAAWVLRELVRVVRREDEERATEPRLTERRRFLQGGAAAAGFAALAGFGGRALQSSRYDVSAERAKISLPPPAEPVPTVVPRGTDLGKSGVPWQTPSGAFYRIDTAIDVPQIAPETWKLRIHGMVDHELTLDFAELKKRPMIERWITLCCVSNPVGGPLISNALWLGTRLADLLREVGIQDGADQLLMTSIDGYTFGAPTKVVMDGRDSLLAIGMNGDPLPIEHGFPVRVVVPGLYGYVSACKWIVDINATTFAERAYWVQGGWVSGAVQPDVKLESRIDTPRPGGSVPAGRPVTVAGIAWDQHVGVSAVGVQVDDGPWLPARLATVPSVDTWRQWALVWTPPKPGGYTLRVRATDAAGMAQTTQREDTFPSGATGLHTITVHAH